MGFSQNPKYYYELIITAILKIKVPLEALRDKGCSDKCHFRTECPQNPKYKT